MHFPENIPENASFLRKEGIYMIRVDLITGFLGSGKTTFIKKYAQYWISQGEKVGILENDYGAVNVDMLLLQSLRGQSCELEMVAGGCDADCHRRRFKTKLISMAMTGYNRVIIEPSGLFDMDEFFDALREEPLENWYEIGSVITVLEAKRDKNLSETEEYFLLSQLFNAGTILLSKQDKASPGDLAETMEYLAEASQKLGTRRALTDLVVDKPWEALEPSDYEAMAASGYQLSSYVKKLTSIEEAGFMTVYLLEHGMREDTLRALVAKLYSDETYGQVHRIKGFFLDEAGSWYELNATRAELSIEPIPVGQEVLIIIGHNLDEDGIKTKIANSYGNEERNPVI